MDFYFMEDCFLNENEKKKVTKLKLPLNMAVNEKEF